MKGITGRVNSNYKDLKVGVFLKCCRSSKGCLPEVGKEWGKRISHKKIKQNEKKTSWSVTSKNVDCKIHSLMLLQICKNRMW